MLADVHLWLLLFPSCIISIRIKRNQIYSQAFHYQTTKFGGIMVGVNVRKFKGLDEALKRFRSEVRKAKIIELSNQKSRFVSRSEMRHKSRRRKSTKVY